MKRTTAISIGCILFGVGLAEAAPKPAGNSCLARFGSPMLAAPVKWFGPCIARSASGYGVARAYRNGKPTAAFYGMMEKGLPSLGVIDSPEGFLAGRFNDGAILDTDDRQLIIAAFDAAAKGARAAAAAFKASGNTASAQYYRQKALALERQMD